MKYSTFEVVLIFYPKVESREKRRFYFIDKLHAAFVHEQLK